MINTVPVRARLTAATTTTDLLDQLQGAYNDTLEHQHLALSAMHRITGHDKLFDTLFAYETTRSAPPRWRAIPSWPSPTRRFVSTTTIR
ncbi:non-ribosomal peptide synthase [Mycobacterium shigaense]|uniref:Non-ribosomal peptide synthase n=1 Tax=Mycobacterium shigaense TaxID=722731 RepID=A0A1Z4EHV0_9MYCO|nr:non-ribosomal peptide synthase [Mycobacterium shigaense]